MDFKTCSTKKKKQNVYVQVLSFFQFIEVCMILYIFSNVSIKIYTVMYNKLYLYKRNITVKENCVHLKING